MAGGHALAGLVGLRAQHGGLVGQDALEPVGAGGGRDHGGRVGREDVVAIAPPRPWRREERLAHDPRGVLAASHQLGAGARARCVEPREVAGVSAGLAERFVDHLPPPPDVLAVRLVRVHEVVDGRGPAVDHRQAADGRGRVVEGRQGGARVRAEVLRCRALAGHHADHVSGPAAVLRAAGHAFAGGVGSRGPEDAAQLAGQRGGLLGDVGGLEDAVRLGSLPADLARAIEVVRVGQAGAAARGEREVKRIAVVLSDVHEAHDALALELDVGAGGRPRQLALGLRGHHAATGRARLVAGAGAQVGARKHGGLALDLHALAALGEVAVSGHVNVGDRDRAARRRRLAHVGRGRDVLQAVAGVQHRAAVGVDCRHATMTSARPADVKARRRPLGPPSRGADPGLSVIVGDLGGKPLIVGYACYSANTVTHP